MYGDKLLMIGHYDTQVSMEQVQTQLGYLGGATMVMLQVGVNRGAANSAISTISNIVG